MTDRTSSNMKWMAETSFKKVDGGYLFETPNPWLFGRGRSYIVNEEQRQALLGAFRSRQTPGLRGGLIAAAVIIAYTVGVSLLWAAFSPRPTPGPLDLLGLMVTILLPLYAVVIVLIRRHLRRTAPITAEAVPTKARIASGERLRAIGEAMPTKLLVAVVAIWFLSAITTAVAIAIQVSTQVRLDNSRLYMPIFQLVLSLSLGFFFSYALRQRLRRTK